MKREAEENWGADAAHHAPDRLSSPVDKNRRDFTIYSGEWAIGRIYEERGGPDRMPWFWSLHGIFSKPADMRAEPIIAFWISAKLALSFSQARGRWASRRIPSPSGCLPCADLFLGGEDGVPCPARPRARL